LVLLLPLLCLLAVVGAKLLEDIHARAATTAAADAPLGVFLVFEQEEEEEEEEEEDVVEEEEVVVVVKQNCLIVF